MKLWSGRFEKDTDGETDAFNASLPFDINLYRYDIEGSVAHSEMLARCGIISAADAQSIREGLSAIEKEIESGKLTPYGEDVHMFIESELTARIGEAGKRLHTARSRNDQVATDLRLYLRGSVDHLCNLLKNLIATLLRIANVHTGDVMPGYTHLQKAQPITISHYLAAYIEMFSRDIDRLSDARKRINVLPLGSGALAGTTYPIDREYTAALLNFDGVCQNSLDGVSDRDFALEYLFALSVIAMHLSRFSEEIILFNTDEFSFITLDDAFATGSSIMPQKKNPDIPELIRGKTGRVYGDLLQLFTVMKGLPLAYNKDLQEDKESIFDAEKTVVTCLSIFEKMLRTATFRTDNMKKSTQSGYLNATEVADYLVKKGMPFRDAHAVSGRIVLSCIKQGRSICDLSLKEMKDFSDLFDDDILTAVQIDTAVNERNTIGGPSQQTMERYIQTTAEKFQISL